MFLKNTYFILSITDKTALTNKSKRMEVTTMNHIHIHIHSHSLDVRLNKETDAPELYCIAPQCCYRVNYDPSMVTHHRLFGKDVANLLSEERK